MYTDSYNDKNTDSKVDAFFESIDKTIEQVNIALQNAQVDIDLSQARSDLRNAGKNVSRTVHFAKKSSENGGQGFLGTVISAILRILNSLFGTKPNTQQSPLSDEDLPFVEEDTPSPPPREPELQIPLSGDSTVDAVIRFQLSQIAFAEECAAQICLPHPQTYAQIREICRTHRCILYALAKKPDILPKLQKFFGYYVPTLKKFSVAYVDLSRQTQAADSPNARKTMAELEEAFVSLGQAFHKKADSLYGAVELDISSDISVLEAMLRKDGLV